MKEQSGLTSKLIDLLQGEKIVSLITNDEKTGQPDLAMISWVVANSRGDRINFAIGHNASSAKNIQTDPNVILGVIGAGSCFSIKGKGKVSDIIEKTIKVRVVSVEIESVEDVMFYGGKVITEPAYEKTYNKSLAEKLDNEIYSLLIEKKITV
ncbi:pyridoxamine 5'-phosphate oxidase family protein [Bacillus sp. V3B]|uniref:pyridoxamine 5'-phosphate oxidase family protein n=1 Tax=Bacillus sp. V3B TaxID=2804915 RepID=UPI00210AC988|nr:pyridoxamine 5'-phosphate oxidase family protein [Bacillus sp. V3B]MCQ6277403.1 pyridoxamine 5'-phosphate oxidase family protein [Bacillus sp. V3B]